MQPVNLFDLAAQQARWLGVRQATVAGNIANVNTPGYGAKEVEPFESILSKKQVPMAATDARHILVGGAEASWQVRAKDEPAPFAASENTVVLEKELMQAGEVKRQFEINTAIVKSFHRMLMMTARPG